MLSNSAAATERTPLAVKCRTRVVAPEADQGCASKVAALSINPDPAESSNVLRNEQRSPRAPHRSSMNGKAQMTPERFGKN